MYPVGASHENPFSQVLALPAKFQNALPTFDKTLDIYFEEVFPAIIAEWELLTDNDLRDFEHRLTSVSGSMSALEKNRQALKKRAADLQAVVTSLERSR
jgi:hypothetical protein